MMKAVKKTRADTRQRLASQRQMKAVKTWIDSVSGFIDNDSLDTYKSQVNKTERGRTDSDEGHEDSQIVMRVMRIHR